MNYWNYNRVESIFRWASEASQKRLINSYAYYSRQLLKETDRDEIIYYYHVLAILLRNLK